jgi:hypothetical protein
MRLELVAQRGFNDLCGGDRLVQVRLTAHFID